jgi:hypothetical protein
VNVRAKLAADDVALRHGGKLRVEGARQWAQIFTEDQGRNIVE